MPTSVPCAETWQGKTTQQCSGPKELAVQKIALAELMVLPPLFIRPADRSKPVSNSSCEHNLFCSCESVPQLAHIRALHQVDK